MGSLTSAHTAIEGGADWLELCSALRTGSLISYIALLLQIRRRFPSAHAFPASCKIILPSGMYFPREGVPMGISELDAWRIQLTSLETVRAVRTAIDKRLVNFHTSHFFIARSFVMM